MSSVEFNEDYESDVESLSGSVASFMNWAGAILSLILIGGLAYWGYALLVRDVAGVPVVRALEGPMRIAPEDPGGTRADYQGLSVTRVAVDGTAEAEAEQVVLAPAPIDLAEEDLPLAALLPSDPADVTSVAVNGAVGTPETQTQTMADAGAEPALSAIEQAIAEALGQDIETVQGTEDAPSQLVLASASGVAPLVPPSVRGVSRSPRPMLRPASLVTAVSVSSVPTEATLDLDAAEIAPGTRLVQLGAFPSPEAANAAWVALSDQFADYMGDKRRLVQEAQAGGKTFYRLRAVGYEDLSDARRFCAVLVAGNANCIPVIHR